MKTIVGSINKFKSSLHSSLILIPSTLSKWDHVFPNSSSIGALVDGASLASSTELNCEKTCSFSIPPGILQSKHKSVGRWFDYSNKQEDGKTRPCGFDIQKEFNFDHVLPHFKPLEYSFICNLI